MNEQKGFTLIELIVVIVILGILAATALPKFVDLSGDAKTAAIQGAAGALTSAATMNYSNSLVRGTGATGTGGVTRLNGASAAAALTSGMIGWDSAKFAIATDTSCAAASAGSALNVTLSYSGGTTANTATATIVCTG